MEQENQKRILCVPALVIEVFTGADDHSRVAKVRTASGEKGRPLQRLFPLEVHYHIPVPPTANFTSGTSTDNVPETSTPSKTLTRLLTTTMTRSGRIPRPPDRLTFKWLTNLIYLFFLITC